MTVSNVQLYLQPSFCDIRPFLNILLFQKAKELIGLSKAKTGALKSL